MATTQRALTIWSKTLAATGGALEPTKTFFVPIIPEWKGNKVILQKAALQQRLFVDDSNGRSYITQKDPTQSYFSLGIWLSPTGDESRQVQHLKDLISEWGMKTSTNKLTWHLARIAIQSTVG
jgi:hypothetical protein